MGGNELTDCITERHTDDEHKVNGHFHWVENPG